MSKERLMLMVLAWFHLSGAVFTFGTVWNRIECGPNNFLEPECRAIGRPVASVVAAAFWPLAQSAIAQEGGE